MMKKRIYLKARPKKKIIHAKTFSLSLMIIGIVLIFLAIWPIVSFNLISAPKFLGMEAPVPDNLLGSTERKSSFYNIAFLNRDKSIVEAYEEDQEEVINNTNLDYTKASVWFPKRPPVKISQQEGKNYYLSIPKLKIKDALVMIGSDDLNKSLIHYGGTAFPGDYGNAVIFGHSVLPYFFNPKDYKTIFSTLPSLNEDDEVFVNYDNITYRYVVYEMKVVTPDDVSILEQRFDNSYLSIITCVPPGSYTSRLWVKAKLERI